MNGSAILVFYLHTLKIIDNFLGVRYPCTECDYEAKAPGHLKRHVESIHQKIKHPCDQCEYAATTACWLKQHKKEGYYILTTSKPKTKKKTENREKFPSPSH